MITFKYETEALTKLTDRTNLTVVVTTDAKCLVDVIETFTQFLRGCGYTVDGVLELVKDDR